MGVWAFLCLILIIGFSPVSYGSAASDLISQARDLLGEDPKAALTILDDLEKNNDDPTYRFEADLVRCDYFVDNDDANKALEITRKWKQEESQLLKTELLRVHLCEATAKEKLGEFSTAADIYKHVLNQTSPHTEATLHAESLLNLGQLHGLQGDFAESLELLQKAQKIFEQEELPQKKRITLNSIAILYGRVGENKKAIEYFEEVLSQNRKLGKRRNTAVVLYNMGRRYEDLQDYKKALSHLRESLEIHKELKNEGSQALILRTMAGVYNKTQQPEKALPLLKQSLSIIEMKNLAKSRTRLHIEQAVSLRLLRRYSEAQAELNLAEAHADKSPSPMNSIQIAEQRSLIFADTKDWQKAYQWQTRFKLLADENLTQQKENQLTRVQLRFETHRKDQANLLLRRELETASKVQLLQLGLISLGALLFSLGGFFAIRQVRLTRKMEALALTDELTQIPNRRHILAYGDEAMRTCREQGKPFSLLVFDIDFFKRINDTYGHAVGDIVIQRIATLSKSMLRQYDRIGRVGGEEFLVILPFTSAEAAKDVGERLCNLIANTDMSDLQIKLNVTVSVGVASSLDNESPLEHIMNLADEALYHVKQNGRNGVRLRMPA